MAPNLPRNERFQDGKGQVDQRFVRFMDKVKDRAFRSLQSFSEMADLDTIGTVDAANDLLLIYDADVGEAKKLPVASVIPVGDDAFQLIEQWVPTTVASKVFSSISQDYDDLVMTIDGIGGTDAVSSVFLEFSSDGGSGYHTGGGSTLAMNAISTSTPAVNVTTFPGVAVIAYVRNGADVTSGFFQMREYSKSSLVPKTFEGHGGVTGTTGTAQVWGHLVGLGPVNAIRISVNSGTFRAGGVVRLYGRR